MGFLDIMKRAMGFGPEEDDDLEIEGIDATVTPLRQRTLQLAESSSSTEENVEPDAGERNQGAGSLRDLFPAGEMRPGALSGTGGPKMPDASEIFEKVVEIFNGALPDFLRNSVDPEKERKELFDALDASMKDYFGRLEKDVEKCLQGRFVQERIRLHEEIESLRQKSRKEEEDTSNARNLQLSAERQKRALSERVHDLEKQIATLEAENEQYILENKSMANKLRMAALSDRDLDNPEAETLMAQLAQERSRLDSEKEALEIARTAWESEKTELTAGKLALETEKTDLENQIATLRESLEQAKAKDELSMAMVNDLNSRAAEARNSAQKKEQESAEMRRKLDEANLQLAAVNEKLAAAQADLQVVREVQSQLARLEETQRVTEANLRRQKDELLEKDEIIRAKDADLIGKNTTMRLKDEAIRHLEDQTDSLRKSIENLQYEKTQTESALRSEIERLKAIKGASAVAEVSLPEVSVASEPEDALTDLTLDLPALSLPETDVATPPKPRRGRPPKVKTPVGDLNPEDSTVKGSSGLKQEVAPEDSAARKKGNDEDDFDLLDMTDWLIATPQSAQKPKRQRKQSKAEPVDDNFGYKEPLRQEPPDNPAQMLLW